MKNYIQIEDPKDCCGCGACASACPCGALTMKEDDLGFTYPSVDEALCVGCGKCSAVCVFGKRGVGEGGAPQVYAACTKDKDTLAASSSGGLFTELAAAVFAEGGVVFGAAFGEDFALRHICVESEDDLAPLRGSKYVQSDTGDTFRAAREFLGGGRTVFYTGTPCQIAGLKSFLGKEYDHLLTADLICHGVPSVKMLRDDISYMAGRKKITPSEVKFRDKQYGWGVVGSLSDGKTKVKYSEVTSPYYFCFLGGEDYRDSCYNCRFPTEGRQGDITLGDYWGVPRETVSALGATEDGGVSCILVNTEKGKRWLERIAARVSLVPTDRASVEKRNKQLTRASAMPPSRDALFAAYRKEGYPAFLRGYKKQYKKRVVVFVKSLIPKKVKRALARMYGKIKGK